MQSKGGVVVNGNKSPELNTPRRSLSWAQAFLAGVLALAGASASSGCDIIPSSYRARITVEVDTPQGVRSGSSVVEFRAGKTFGLLPQEAKAQVELRGEAVAVDLPGGQSLFALLRPASGGQSMERAITEVLDPDFKGGAEGFLESVPKLGDRAMLGRSAVLPPASYPMLVRFRNLSDPTSVEEVDPNEISSSPWSRIQASRYIGASH